MGAGIVERLIQGSLFFVALASALSTPVRVARCWKEASELLKSSPAVVVKNALSPEAQDAWRAASCGDVRVTDIRQGLAELFHEEPPEVVVKEAEGVAASFATHFLDGDDVRFRASLAVSHKSSRGGKKNFFRHLLCPIVFASNLLTLNSFIFFPRRVSFAAHHPTTKKRPKMCQVGGRLLPLAVSEDPYGQRGSPLPPRGERPRNDRRGPSPAPLRRQPSRRRLLPSEGGGRSPAQGQQTWRTRGTPPLTPPNGGATGPPRLRLPQRRLKSFLSFSPRTSLLTQKEEDIRVF
mmetsp:Transcript_11777/g.38752  ORF Transcript_11777/g.38752 Transcript_11777/m.38752 type:complete len:293 (+) Transcript_11777:109-987(+)